MNAILAILISYKLSVCEGKGNHQGGLASGDEWKLYNNEMIQQLEDAATALDRISGFSTSCVAVADDAINFRTAQHNQKSPVTIKR